ncbi:MAG: saccharopine dehydrogenase NADP-binding domain-containing protein [Gemmatimonadetes bacterium]|nr:saccharopine dehydrogenase NADP-binding domain-containing protein [Gemmatimonadota bacterium]
MAKPLLIYGVTGYTGRLILDEALARGLKPIISGRNAEAVRALAAQHGLEARPVSLDDPEALRGALTGIGAVLHCAGPFFRTVSAMLDACLDMGVHYMDITGEIAVFERLAGANERARVAGITLLPGVGFDVVPTDCLAAHLKSRLPGANSLTLAFSGGSAPSHGTAATVIEGMGLGGAIRRNGRIERVPSGWRTRTIAFADKPRLCVTIPWGDVSTAFHSTGIPDITTYMATSLSGLRGLRLSRFLEPVLRMAAVKRFMLARLKSRPAGPGPEALARAKSQVWGEVRDASGKVVQARLTAPNGYKLTAVAAVRAAERLLAGGVPTGFTTPSKAFGADFVLEIPGTVREDLP